MEIVNEEDLKRYAVIDFFDVIIYDSDDYDECLNFYKLFGEEEYLKGIYDYKENKYIRKAIL
ncbi:MAG: hypothetical protein J6K85_04245 [Clostridia bacterium]|nr:hypothetical protein [Clostridia bacterium]